jgi:hypothetical protein
MARPSPQLVDKTEPRYDKRNRQITAAEPATESDY